MRRATPGGRPSSATTATATSCSTPRARARPPTTGAHPAQRAGRGRGDRPRSPGPGRPGLARRQSSSTSSSSTCARSASSAFAASRSDRRGGFQTNLSQLLRARPRGDEARRRADPGAPCRVSAPRRSGDRVPARRHGARLGAAANGARARADAARSAARAPRPIAVRSSSPSPVSAATLPQAERSALRRGRDAASSTTSFRRYDGCAPSVADEYLRGGRRWCARELSPTAPRSTPSRSAARRRPT